MLVKHSEREEIYVHCPRTARAKEKRLVPTTTGPRRLPPRNDLGGFPEMQKEAIRLCTAHTSRARPPVPVEQDQWWTEPGAEAASRAGLREGPSRGGNAPGLSPT